MVNDTQTIRRQEPTNCLSVFDHFVGWRLKGSNLQNTQFLRKFSKSIEKQYEKIQ